MKLCKHLEPIYQNEIKKGNSIVYLTRWGEHLILYFKKKMNGYTPNFDLKFSIQNDTHYLHDQRYLCSQCHCVISSPVEENQYGWCHRDRLTVYSDEVVATPETIEIPDYIWENFPHEVVPKFVGFEDQY